MKRNVLLGLKIRLDNAFNLIDLCFGPERILAGEEGGGHDDADQDEVATDGVSLHLPAEHPEPACAQLTAH